MGSLGILQNKSAGPATCHVLETWGDSVSVGPPSVVYDGLTEGVSLSTLSTDVGIMCYTLSSSSMLCRTVSIVPTTTTSTQTETHTSSSTITSTSETFTTTSPHTTTVTSLTQTSVTEFTELSGGPRSSVSCFLMAASATVVATLFA